jgi:hypothetical protein
MDVLELLQKSKRLFDDKQYLIAKEHLQAYLEQDQNNIEALLLLALCDEALGKTKAMASSLFKILSIDTSNERALEKLRNTGFLGKTNNDVDLVEQILDDGSVYLLPMHNDIIDGFGAILKKDMFYAGMLKNNTMQGHGLMKGSNGTICVGNFNKGNFEGEGTLITENFQAKTTFIGAEPDGENPVEIKWENGNRVVFSIEEKRLLADINNWSDIEFFETDGSSYEIDIDNGDSVNIITGEAFLWKQDGDFRDSHWGDSVKEVLSTIKATNIQKDKKYISYAVMMCGFVCNVFYLFDNNHLTNAGFMVTEEYDDPQTFAADYDRFASFFNKKYGRPTKGTNELSWYVNYDTVMTMPKWSSGMRKISAIYSPS